MVRRQLSMNEEVWIVKHMNRLRYPVNVQRLWCKEINNNPPHRDTIRVLMNNFEETGSLPDISPPRRLVSVAGQTTKDAVSSILQKKTANIDSSNERRFKYFKSFSSTYLQVYEI